MRHSGLRISDVTKLDSSQLVKRAGGNGWAIQVMQQKKTKEFVRIPITAETADALHALPFKGEKDGKNYLVLHRHRQDEDFGDDLEEAYYNVASGRPKGRERSGTTI